MDSIWLSAPPQIGVPLTINAHYYVGYANVDSLLLKAYYVNRWSEQEITGEVSKVVQAHFPDTLQSSLTITINEPGEFLVHFWVLAWHSRDTTGVPHGANAVIKVDVPATGPGTVVDKFDPRRHRPGARLFPTPPKPKFVPRDSAKYPLGREAGTRLDRTTRPNFVLTDYMLRKLIRDLSASEVAQAIDPRELQPIYHESEEPVSVAQDAHLLASARPSAVRYGDSTTSVAAIIGIGPEIALVALASCTDSENVKLVFGRTLIRLPPPFFGAQIERFDDVTEDELPDIVVTYFGGNSWHMRIFQWFELDGESRLRELSPDETDPYRQTWFMGTGIGLEYRVGDRFPEPFRTDKLSSGGYSRVKYWYRYTGSGYELIEESYWHPDSLEEKVIRIR